MIKNNSVYFSDDDEEDTQNSLTIDDITDDEIDDDMRNIIYQASNKSNEIDEVISPLSSGSNSSNPFRRKKTLKKVLSLDEFNKLKTDNKPKKFVSRRVSEKKKNNCIEEVEIVKRCFNPRMKPYNLYNMKLHTIKKSNTEDFPTLNKKL
jgi:hypothetical protein